MPDIARFHIGPRLSEIAVHNGTVYLAGQVPDDTTLDMRGQTAQVLGMVERLLAEAGSDKSRILMTQIFLNDIEDITVMNEIWDAWIPAGQTPPRATVQAKMANAAYKIEIVVTAAQA
jgi:enamine deaminase RidA (YjgF/YER057c/UK114 family)